MQLTVASWVWWSIGLALLVGVTALWITNLVYKIRSRETMSEDRVYGSLIASVLGIMVGGLLVWSITDGGIEAQQVEHDLHRAGYTVVDIQTSGDTATLKTEGRFQEVQLLKRGSVWAPMVTCPLLPNGTVNHDPLMCTVVKNGQ